MFRLTRIIVAALAMLCVAPLGPITHAQQPVTLTVRADRPGVRIDPMFYGLMTEEINFSYDGGLYAELIRNRTFRDDAASPAHWSVVQDGGARATIALAQDPVPGTALTTALALNASSTSSTQRVGVANEGYWGIPVKPDTTYRVSFWAKAAEGMAKAPSASASRNGCFIGSILSFNYWQQPWRAAMAVP